MSITTILFIVKGEVKIGGSSPSPFVAQLPLQMINLQLHVLSIFLMRGVTPNSRLTSISMGGDNSLILHIYIIIDDQPPHCLL